MQTQSQRLQTIRNSVFSLQHKGHRRLLTDGGSSFPCAWFLFCSECKASVNSPSGLYSAPEAWLTIELKRKHVVPLILIYDFIKGPLRLTQFWNAGILSLLMQIVYKVTNVSHLHVFQLGLHSHRTHFTPLKRFGNVFISDISEYEVRFPRETMNLEPWWLQ